jgi:ketosteroid isomerase-like protein
MTNEHPNVALVRRMGELLATGDLSGAQDYLANDFVWHYINPRLPDVAGDYTGFSGLESLFARIRALSANTFKVEPISAMPFGNEFVVAYARVTLVLKGTAVETNAVTVWRVHENRLREVWDIPAIYSARPQARG